jgi:hypothetical protein
MTIFFFLLHWLKRGTTHLTGKEKKRKEKKTMMARMDKQSLEKFKKDTDVPPKKPTNRFWDPLDFVRKSSIWLESLDSGGESRCFPVSSSQIARKEEREQQQQQNKEKEKDKKAGKNDMMTNQSGSKETQRRRRYHDKHYCCRANGFVYNVAARNTPSNLSDKQHQQQPRPPPFPPLPPCLILPTPCILPLPPPCFISSSSSRSLSSTSSSNLPVKTNSVARPRIVVQRPPVKRAHF